MEQEEHEAEEAGLWVKEEARMATERARQEEEEREQEQIYLAEEARAWDEEEAARRRFTRWQP